MICKASKKAASCSRAAHGICAGYSLYEFIVLIIVASLVGVGLADRLNYYQELAEKTAMEATVRNIRSGLQYRRAELLIQENAAETAKLLTQNPITWLDMPPANYVGEVSNAGAVAIPPGSWYFDSSLSQLVYVPRFSSHLVFLTAGETRIRYRVTSLTPQGTTQKETSPLLVLGIGLTLQTPYSWF